MTEQEQDRQPGLDITLLVVNVLLLTVLSVLVKSGSYNGQQICKAASGFALLSLVAAGFLISRLHALVEDLNPLTAMVSEYALDKTYGQLMHNSFFAIGGGAWLICLCYCVSGHGAFWMELTMFGAGLGSSAMGIFSMKSRMDNEIQTTSISGKLHDLSLGVAFGSGTISMLVLTVMCGIGVEATYPWLRAAALVQFNITALAMVFFLILGYKKRAAIKQMFAEKAGATLGYVSATGRYNYWEKDRHVHCHTKGAENYGQGVVERILIFLFIQWGCFLSVLLLLGSWHRS